MTLYSVYEPPSEAEDIETRADSLVFIKEGFSWGALLVPGLWLIYRRMWLELVVFLGLFLVLAYVFGPSDPGKTVFGWLSLALVVLFAFEGFRLKRISAFLNPDEHLATEGWQLLQSQIGFASGGFWGNGPGNSRAKWGYLPEADTDFILAVIGEELGLIGSLVVLGAFVVFMLAGIRIAMRTRDRFGRLVAFGITTWIGVQALINIGVTVGTLPTKGITLPFVSYGGSSLMMCMLAVGVMMSVARARRAPGAARSRPGR